MNTNWQQIDDELAADSATVDFALSFLTPKFQAKESRGSESGSQSAAVQRTTVAGVPIGLWLIHTVQYQYIQGAA